MKRLFLSIGLICCWSLFVGGQNLQVWPGDANNNGIVNHVDFLQLGLAYNFFGPARTQVSPQWSGQAANAWNYQFSDSLNFAFADCNGDGIVNYTYDAFPIYVHYENTHGLVTNDIFPVGSSLSDPALSFSPDSSPLMNAGQSFEIPLHLGSTAMPLEDFYGIAFSIVTDRDYVKVEQTTVNFDIFSWANPDNDRIFSVYHPDSDLNKVDVAWVRTDHNERQGGGKIGSLNFIIIDNVVGLQSNFQIRLENIRAIDKFGNLISIAGDSISVQLNPDAISPVEKAPEKERLRVFPNPTDGLLHLRSADELQSLRLFNALGQLVFETALETSAVDLQLPTHLPIGLYRLEVDTQKGIFSQKIQIF